MLKALAWDIIIAGAMALVLIGGVVYDVLWHHTHCVCQTEEK
jgi:hypothetical protein